MTDARTVAAWLALGTEQLGAAGLAEPRREAAALLGAALGWDGGQVWLRGPEPVPPAAAARYLGWLDRRAAREPFAYLTGEKEWFGLRLQVSPAVLIPRPETELLAEHALAVLPADLPVRVLDLCTGSGCLAVALALHRPLAKVTAVDISAAALAVARRNAQRHGVDDRIALVEADVLGDPAWAPAAGAGPVPNVDLIVANPPYVAPQEHSALQPDVRDYEPVSALVPPNGDALAFYRHLAAACPLWLAPGGVLAAETGAGQAPTVAALLGATRFWREVAVLPDYSGIGRIVTARRA